MGYRSDLRVILKRKDFEELTNTMNKWYAEREIHSLFDEDFLQIIKENENWVKFGWNGLKWYYSYEEVKLIQDFITSRDQFFFLRLGEEYGDEETMDHLDYEPDCPSASYVYHYIED